MSYIDTDNYGYSEREVEQNWAAEYAKIVTNELEEKHDEDVAGLETEISAVASDLAAAAASHAADVAALETEISAVASDLAAAAASHAADVAGLETEISAVVSDLAAAAASHATDIAELEATESAIADGTLMSDNAIKTRHIADSQVKTGKLEDGAVTIAKLAPDARVLHEYNTAAPVKIGTWTHNGTTKNIYRKAFQIDYDDLIAPPTIEFADLGLDLDYYDEVVIIDRKCVLIIRDMQPRNVGDVVPAAQEGNVDHEYIFSFHALPSTIQNYLRDDGGIFYGYIDYIYIPAGA
ncbi:MAG: hypothetical protein IJH94_07485 [Clostridia bacterium]|nr:hypothetical protein [Clostridia bacterium]